MKLRSLRPLALCLLSCLTLGVPAQTAPSPSAAALAGAPETLGSITAAELRAHIAYLAGDSLQGRLTGTPGQQEAARYVANHFRELGLLPLGETDAEGGRRWTQTYPVTLTRVTDDSGLMDASGKSLHAHGAWTLPRRSRGSPEADLVLEGPLRFLGHLNKESDLTGEDLAHVIPVAVVDMDTSQDDHLGIMQATFLGMSREMGRLRQAAVLLERAGASGAVLLTRRFNLPFLTTANMMAIYPGKPLVARGEDGRGGILGMQQRTRVPLLTLAGSDAESVLEALGLEASVLSEESGQGSRRLTAASHRLVLRVKREAGSAENVIGLLPGRDPTLKSEALIYSAHMDHVGLAADGQAFNGADDNASGTSALLELAEAAALLPPEARPRRSLIFLSVSGEELGLWGSDYFASHPTWPLGDLVANINIDMIGRSTESVPEDAVSVTPTFSHKAYSTLAREAASLEEAFNLRLVDGNRFYTRSDHYHFARKGVPVIFFCDDEHPDYHLPSDDPDRIEAGKMERIVRLAFLLGHRTAESTTRPQVLGRRPSWFAEAQDPPEGETGSRK